MGNDSLGTQGFEAIKERLEEIAEAVGSDDVPLDQALDLFEEAVGLGMQASELLEEGVLAEHGSAESSESQQPVDSQSSL